MTEKNLTELLEDAGNRVPVGAPPLDGIAAGARTVRGCRRTGAAAGAVVLVAAAVVAGVVLSGGNDPVVRHRPPTPADTPAGMRLVGIGHAAIAVPVDWGTNKTRCGTPEADTVIFDQGGIPACLAMVPDVYDTVEISEGRPNPDLVRLDGTTTVSGEQAERSSPDCRRSARGAHGRLMRACTATIYLPDEDVAFTAGAKTEAGVETILSGIRIEPDLIAVPGYIDLSNEAQGKAGGRYAALLERLGLTRTVTQKVEPGMPPGFVVGAIPAPGTMVSPGTEVHVTQIAPPRGPQDEVEIYVNADDPKNVYNSGGIVSLSNLAIAKDPRITVPLGQSVWSYAYGKRSKTFAVALTGDALEQRGPGGPTYPNDWVAKRIGTSTLTLSIQVDGKPLALGTVTIVVHRG